MNLEHMITITIAGKSTLTMMATNQRKRRRLSLNPVKWQANKQEDRLVIVHQLVAAQERFLSLGRFQMANIL